MRRVPPSFLLRLKEGGKAGLTVLLTLLTLEGIALTAYSAAGNKVPLNIAFAGGLACVLAGFIVAFFRGRMKHIPDSIVDEWSQDGDYDCSFCTRDGLKEACEMTRPFYGTEYAPFEIVEQWRLKNPKAFAEIRNEEGLLCACYGVMPLEEGFMDQFIAGRVTDLQCEEDCILSFPEASHAKRLYVSGVVVRDAHTFAGNKRARVMIWCIVQYLRMLYGSATRELYALSVNAQSERLLINMGFRLVGDPRRRRDQSKLYSATFTEEFAAELLHRTGDYNAMCHFHADMTLGAEA